jgi:hypothetical protein
MRVELIYNPKCELYKSVHKVLEDIIAEERLPIPVEMVEDKTNANPPFIRLDGHLIMNIKRDHTFDHLRDFVHKKWTEINHPKKHQH